MQVYKKILVAIDCSPVDDAIIGHVLPLALQNEAQVYLLHVVHSHTLDQDRVLRRTALACLNSHREKLAAEGVETHILIRSGEPDIEIVKEIEGENYDLVAMATHGHSLLAGLLFGSVSRTLKQRITVPLLLVGGAARRRAARTN
jgi:nucleotide-binding universal stress UspA family protein